MSLWPIQIVQAGAAAAVAAPLLRANPAAAKYDQVVQFSLYCIPRPRCARGTEVLRRTAVPPQQRAVSWKVVGRATRRYETNA